MVNFKDLLSEIRMAVSADYKITPSGRKVHKMKKVADDPRDLDNDGDVDADDKKLAKEEVEEVEESFETSHEFHLRQAAHHEKTGNLRQAEYHRGRAAEYKQSHDEYVKAFRKEDTELEEAVDKKEQRFMLLARMGLVDKADVSKLRIAMEQLKADKPLSIAQRSLLLSVMTDLVSLVTGDDTVFNRVKMDIQKEGTISEGENKQMKGDDPCWKGYQMVGMKDKNGKKVPNCVPANEETELDEGQMKRLATDAEEDKRLGSWRKETPWVKTTGTTTDKSGAKHTPMSTAKHLARLALKKQQSKTTKSE